MSMRTSNDSSVTQQMGELVRFNPGGSLEFSSLFLSHGLSVLISGATPKGGGIVLYLILTKVSDMAELF